jgi:hypothetical protein
MNAVMATADGHGTAGHALAQGFWREVVRPLLEPAWAARRCSAALMGQGSEVLGYDDDRSG